MVSGTVSMYDGAVDPDILAGDDTAPDDVRVPT
jgi:hypothetical protein